MHFNIWWLKLTFFNVCDKKILKNCRLKYSRNISAETQALPIVQDCYPPGVIQGGCFSIFGYLGRQSSVNARGVFQQLN